MTSSAPIFIIGTERSGSNLLRLILNAHPNLVIPHPPHLMNYFGHLDYGDLNSDDNSRKLLRDMLRLIKTHIFPWDEVHLDPQKILGNINQRSHFALVAGIYEQVLQQSEKSRWGCKSTFMIHYVKEVLEVYPNAQFILLVRDPRDVSASAKKSVFSPCHPHLSSKLWDQQQRIGVALQQQYPTVVCTLRYKDLLLDSEANLTALCEFLKEEFSDDLLNFFEKEEAQKSASLSQSWAKTGQSIQSKNIGKYTKNLSRKEIDMVEANCFEMMQHFGFTPLNQNRPELPRTMDRVGIRMSERWMRLQVESASLQNDKNHWTRWRRDLTAGYFSLRHRSLDDLE